MTAWVQLFIRYLPDFLKGAAITLQLTFGGLGIGFLLGTGLALGKSYGSKPIQLISNVYVEVYRGTPLVVQLFLIYYGLPSLGWTLNQTTAAFVALGLNSAAYQAEYLRGAIIGVGESQMQAGRSIGLTRWQTIFDIILPQALRRALPAWSNEPISLLKTTGVVFLIAVQDLMAKGKRVASSSYNPIGAYLAVALVYLAMVFLLTLFFRWLEKRTKIPGLELESK